MIFAKKSKQSTTLTLAFYNGYFFEEFLAANDEQLSLTFLYKIPSKTTHV